jgi:hypothetical protein
LLGTQHCHEGALVAGLGAKCLQDERFMNKRRSESSNRRKVYLGHPFATLPSTNMLKINQHTTKLSKALLTAGLLGGTAVATLGAGSAQAAGDQRDCSFGGSLSGHPLCSPSTVWTIGDKRLTNLFFDPAIPVAGPPTGTFSFIWDDFGAPGISLEDMYSTLVTFDPAIPEPSTGSYSYDLAITAGGYTFGSVELDVDHVGAGQNVQKVVKDALGSTIATLNSVDGMPAGPVDISGTSIKVTDTWTLNPATGTISSISNSYTQVPAPLPILGAGAAFGSIRKLRKFSSRLKTFSMN